MVLQQRSHKGTKQAPLYVILPVDECGVKCWLLNAQPTVDTCMVFGGRAPNFNPNNGRNQPIRRTSS